MMNSPIRFAAPLALLVALGACQEQTIDANNDSQANAANTAAPVEAPPMIQASRTFRCKDNSLLYADYYTNNTVQIHVKDKDAPSVTLTATDAKGPFTGSGYSVSTNATQIDFSAPGKGS